jgi:outer membrane lipoprotein SlyB
MKWIFAFTLTLAALAPTAHAQGVRHGTIVDLKPIDNRGDDESQTHQTGRKFGSLLGNMVGIHAASAAGNAYAANAVASTAPQVGEAVGGNIAGQGPSAHYMVKLQMDDGKVMALVQTGQAMQYFHVGSKVQVSGTGGDARLSAD